MSKKALAEQAAAAREARVQAALRWTEPVERDVPIPVGSYGNKNLSTGFMFGGERGSWPRVDVACSSSSTHAIGQTDSTTSQQPMRLYSTRLLALKALRYAMERHYAEMLADVDEKIAKEEAR